MKLRVPLRFREATLASTDARTFHMLRSYSTNIRGHLADGTGLLLAGPPGIGKTWGMAALTREYASLPIRTEYEFVTAPDFFENIPLIGAARRDDYRGCSFAETYVKVKWLVINDLGKEYSGGKLSEQMASQLGRVLRARSERRQVTHITTNLSSEKLKDDYGESITSLLSEMVQPYLVSGPDLRKARS